MKQPSRSKVVLLLLAIMALVLAGCASSDSEGADTGPGDGGGDETATCQGTAGEPDDAEPVGTEGEADGAGKKIGMVFDVGGKGDKSFNDSAFAGLSAAETNLGVEVKALEPASDGANREQLMRELADEGYELIVGVGFAFQEVLPTIAADYPDTQFAVVDTVVDADNVTSINFGANQGSYLVGAAAAQSSKTGTIGFIGGVDTPLIKEFQAGFVAGAEKVNPDIAVEVKYISTGDDFSGFNDAPKGQTIAEGLYDAGADVVYHASGASGSGVIKAAAAKDRLVIGVDSNQYLTATEAEQPCVLTSMLKRVDVGVYNTILDFVNGDEMGGVHVYDLANDGIGYATQGGQIVDTGELDDLKAEIVEGTIDVPTEP